MDFLPLFLRIRDRDCVVVGGGEVAARKVALSPATFTLAAQAKASTASG